MLRSRMSCIYHEGKYCRPSAQASNALKNLGRWEANLCVMSYVLARIHPPKDQETLEGWILSRFGWRLYEHFFKPYNEKLWGVPASKLPADFAAASCSRSPGPPSTTGTATCRRPERWPTTSSGSASSPSTTPAGAPTAGRGCIGSFVERAFTSAARRVARIMRQKALVRRCRRRFTKTTISDPEVTAADLVRRASSGPAPSMWTGSTSATSPTSGPGRARGAISTSSCIGFRSRHHGQRLGLASGTTAAHGRAVTATV